MMESEEMQEFITVENSPGPAKVHTVQPELQFNAETRAIALNWTPPADSLPIPILRQAFDLLEQREQRDEGDCSVPGV
ncbi:Fibronectin type-III domain-containing protein [Caenorhabditis elegans]|uniref:Fibronectin type-III domain-containing protein n=1 Tax=Caenorhabditis elegans TaxID=6239 RepID=D6VPA6_CAEEL|nr:Fibronectin type-III domain-containing protein [Caenorhabditis elegans]CBM41239.1 Fibronectin type-III domain-containing protein [Caenorhabditis elegans]|eukprot:NP_001024209.2 Uncharacterized protein CELE_Y102A5C.36 [Caenorhabditis elegans]